MTSSETRALRHAALLVLGLGLLRTAVEAGRSPVTTQATVLPDSSRLEVLLDTSRENRDEAQRRALPLTSGERIDPNTSAEEDLDRLPGVGPALAARIVRMRQDRGPFAGPAGIDFIHKENNYDDFAVESLLPYKQSTLGPFMSKGDLNGDGLMDLFIGGAKGQSGSLYFQTSESQLDSSSSCPDAFQQGARCE